MFHFGALDRIANEYTVSGDSFNRHGCGAVQYRERSFPYIQLKSVLGSASIRSIRVISVL
jgi:hypothetical protein